MAGVIGSIGNFDHNVNDWQVYYGRLSQFIKLNDIKETSKSALLLTHLSDETYSLVRNLLHPSKLEDAEFEELVKVLNEHFTPKRCTFADRAKFFDATRVASESVEEWAARVRGLAVHCEFGTGLDSTLRDKFVLGMNAGPERDRLFEQDASTLTLAKALQIAQQTACARAARGVAAQQGGGPHVKQEPVFRMAGERAGGGGGTGARGAGASAGGAGAGGAGAGGAGAGDARRCSVCGLKYHDAERCRYKNYRCQLCGIKGHLKKVCSTAKKGGSSRLHNLAPEGNTSDENDECKGCKECQLFNLRYVNYAPILFSIVVNDIKINMELDTGSGTTVISDKLYKSHFAHIALCKCDIKMCLYNGHKITPQGYFVAEVCYLKEKHKLRIYVVQNGGPPLLGRDFVSKFGMYFTTDNNSMVGINQHPSEVLQLLLKEYSELYDGELGNFNKFKVELHLKEGVQPRFFKPRSVPFALKSRVEDEIDRLVKLGILVPVPYSKYATPIVPVLKENGKVKIAGDFSVTLNRNLKIDKYPLPRIEEVFARIGGGEKYTKIDLSNAYNQFNLSESSQELTTINTSKGLFKYTRLVYGLANAPAIFQRAMESLLVGIDGVSIFLDDVCITGPTAEIHLVRLREVLSRLKEAGLKLQKDKCTFFQDSVTYLGYVIDKNGLRTCPRKVEAIAKAPRPTSVLEVKRFLGVVNYYRNFIPKASAILCPLHRLLRVDVPWEWGDAEERAFENVKRELISDRVLAHFDPEKQLVLTVDASPYGIGALLAQRDGDGTERPLAYGSRSLSTSEKNYSQLQKEATAIVFGVKRFHQYLYGRQEPFILKTDHRPLLSIFGNKLGVSIMAASRLQRYAIILSAYNYIPQYINSADNVVADYFSRAPVSETGSEADDDISFIKFLNSNIAPITFEDIKDATLKDKTLQTVMNYMSHGWPRKINCRIVLPYFHCKTDLESDGGCLLRGHRVVIPTVYRARILDELHKGHFGIVKTKSIARERCWWPNIDRDISQWIGSCDKCSVTRSSPPRVPPAAWPAPPAAWDRLHIDYLSIAQRTYLVVIDAYSKWLECMLMNGGTSTRALIDKLKCLFSRYGLPNTIVSDNDTKINSCEFNNFCKMNGIRYITSPIYHPSSNGQAENSVKTCKKMLKCILEDHNNTVEIINEKLLGFLFEYRNTIHCSTGHTPAKLMLGRDLKSILDLITPPSKIKDGNLKCLSKSRQFSKGELVWLRWYVARKEVWTLGTICNSIGSRMFEIQSKDYGTKCKRHVDQIMKYTGVNVAGSMGDDGGQLLPPPSPLQLPTPPSPPPSPSKGTSEETNVGCHDDNSGTVGDISVEEGEEEWAEAREEDEAQNTDSVGSCGHQSARQQQHANHECTESNRPPAPVTSKDNISELDTVGTDGLPIGRYNLRARNKNLNYKKYY